MKKLYLNFFENNSALLKIYVARTFSNDATASVKSETQFYILIFSGNCVL